MDATLTWLDLTASDRDKMRQVLDLFKEQGTVDEMGLGSLRDALSEALFPGTSTIQTRLRYVLFVPWIYRQLEARRTAASNVPTQLRKAELDLIGPLLENGMSKGVIGERARGSLARQPSSVYWTALVRWGLFLRQRPQGWYHTHKSGKWFANSPNTRKRKSCPKSTGWIRKRKPWPGPWKQTGPRCGNSSRHAPTTAHGKAARPRPRIGWETRSGSTRPTFTAGTTSSGACAGALADGDAIIVRYADDVVVGFEHRRDAERFLHALGERLDQFDLALHPDKTRLIEFGRHAEANRRARGEGRPDTFGFLGFTHYCRKTRSGRFGLGRKPTAKRVRRTLRRRIADVLRRRMHHDLHEVARWLGRVVNGWLNYYAVPTSSPHLEQFIRILQRVWMNVLRRRSQRGRFSWQRLKALVDRYWPKPLIRHPWPGARFAVKYPR